MVEVLVEFDYTAQEPDELTIKKGDIIKDVTQKPGGWWEGTLKDKKGVFPDNFVKVLEKDSVILRNKKDSTRIRQCRVVFSYNQDHVDELSLKVGDVIDIVGEEEEGWWRGVLNGKEGVFPSNFVEEITPPVNRPKPSNRDDLLNKITEPVPALPAKPVKQLCKVQYSYKAQNEDELTLKEGEIVTVLSKDCQDPGWWKGEYNGKVGVFPDNFVVLLPQSTDDKKIPPGKVESKPPPDPSAITKQTSVASQRKSLEIKNAQTKPPDTKTTPPLPGKKPQIKKSPSGSGSIFSKIKEKITDRGDRVDGLASSKPKEAKEVNDLNAFDQVERRPLLEDVRANRARPPGRRLPTALHKDDEDVPSLLNGNAEHVKLEQSTKSEDSFKSEESASSENLDISSDLEPSEAKPKLREWEKHKAPWLEEMKLNQAKRTSVSPVPDPKPKPHVDHKPEPEVSKSSQNSPAEKEVNILDMSKSMSDIKVSPVEIKPIPKPFKTPPNELDIKTAPPIKSKPVVSSLSSVNRHSIGSVPPTRESPSRIVHPPQPIKSSPKPKPDQSENVISVSGSYSSYSSTHTSHSSSVSHSSSEKITSTSSGVTGSTVATESSSSSASNWIEKPDGIVSIAKFNQLLERLAKLENKCEKQGHMIEELKNKLQLETEMRMILQERIMHNNVQV